MALINNADAIYLGDRTVDRVYVGAQRVWPEWTPAELFTNGEQGALYYFTPDFSGLYQDAAGTTPVTAAVQPLGLTLDRRFGLARGVELVPAGYTAGGWGQNFNRYSLVYGADSIEATCIQTYTFQAWPGLRLQGPASITLEAGRYYEFSFTLTTLDASHGVPGTVYFTLGDLTSSASAPYADGTHRVVLRAGSNQTSRAGVGFYDASVGFSVLISGVSVREVPGNHASQPTTTARPTLRSGPLRIDYDGVDDYLRTVFPGLGSDVTIARSIPGVGAQILTGQTIAAGNWDDSVTSCAVLVIDRALTGPETALVTAFLNQQAGV